MEEFSWQLIHRECGKPAFYMKAGLRQNEVLRADFCIGLNGEKFEPNTIMVCGSCGKVIREVTFADYRPREQQA